MADQDKAKLKVKTFGGASVDVDWDERLCIHVGECGRAEGDLFVGGRQPWCQPDVTTVEEVIDVCERCPTGALTYRTKGGDRVEKADAENRVTVSAHGPLFIRGDLNIAGADPSMPGVSFRAALCRCGQSKHKPFCDNSHEAANFRDQGAVGMKADDAAGAGGKLSVKAAPNGPLLLSGNFAMYTASGRLAYRSGRAALCRCGHSKNKPFCDGSHQAAGFKAE